MAKDREVDDIKKIYGILTRYSDESRRRMQTWLWQRLLYDAKVGKEGSELEEVC